MIARGEQKIYTDFLTNLAVAWFAAGIITPLFTPIQKPEQLFATITAVAMSGGSLYLAKQIIKR